MIYSKCSNNEFRLRTYHFIRTKIMPHMSHMSHTIIHVIRTTKNILTFLVSRFLSCVFFMFKMCIFVFNRISLLFTYGVLLFGLPHPFYEHTRHILNHYTNLGDTLEVARLFTKSHGKDMLCSIFVDTIQPSHITLSTRYIPLPNFTSFPNFPSFPIFPKFLNFMHPKTIPLPKMLCNRNDEIASLSLHPISLPMKQWRRWHSFTSPIAWERYWHNLIQMYASYNTLIRYEDKYHATYQMFLKICFGVSLA